MAMLEDVVQFGTGVRAKELDAFRQGRPERRTISRTRGTSGSLHTSRRACGLETTKAHIARKEGDRRARGASDLARVHATGCAGISRAGFSKCGSTREGSRPARGARRYARHGAACRCSRAGANADSNSNRAENSGGAWRFARDTSRCGYGETAAKNFDRRRVPMLQLSRSRINLG